MTEFQRNAKEYVGRLKRAKTPLVLTVNGRAELVVQDAGSYQDMLNRLQELETAGAIRQELEDARKALHKLGAKPRVSR